MRTYKQHISELAPLEAFDEHALIADDKHSQQLCSFVLSLALAFNDLKDLLLAHDFLNGKWPQEDSEPTPEVGEFLGATQHMFRLHLATLHAVLELIEKNARVLKDPAFVQTLNKMSAKARKAWISMAAVATSSPADTSKLSRFLHFARNKVASHYDQKEIAAGFRKAFVNNSAREPYVSRGQTLGTSRLYFADAAAQDYLRKKSEELSAPESILDAVKFINTVTLAIHSLVFAFISGRGFKWCEPQK